MSGQKSRKGVKLQNQLTPSDKYGSEAVQLLTSKLQKSQKNEALSNPDVWRKIAEAHEQHEKFLEKLGINEETEMKAHYSNAGLATGMLGLLKQEAMTMGYEDLKEFQLSKIVKQIPWRKKDVSNPLQERKKVFDSFNKTGGQLPKSPPNGRSAAMNPANPLRPATKKKVKRKTEKTLIFADEFLEDQKHPEINPYATARAKVDTGLGQSRNPNPRYTMNGHIMDNHHPLTIGPQSPQLPGNFGQQNFEIYDSFKTNRATTIANVTARLYKENARKLNHNPHLHKVPFHPDWDSNTSPGLSTARFPVNTRPSNPAQNLRNPAKNVISTTSSQARAKAYNPYGSMGMNKPGVPDGLAGGPRRRYKPSQLMPLHVPGPKYDNIYIGPYSGSESDRDSEDNMDRPVKSRKR